jgi:hypothetical protein
MMVALSLFSAVHQASVGVLMQVVKRRLVQGEEAGHIVLLKVRNTMSEIKIVCLYCANKVNLFFPLKIVFQINKPIQLS